LTRWQAAGPETSHVRAHARRTVGYTSNEGTHKARESKQ